MLRRRSIADKCAILILLSFSRTSVFQLIRSISKNEWRFLGLMAVLVLLVTAVPYLYGYFTAPVGMVYTGLHHLTPGDTNVFLSMIEQVKQGHNIFLNLYTAEPQARLLVNPLWLSVGWLGKVFDFSNLLTLHLARSLWIVIFIFICYLFLVHLLPDVRKRKWIFIIILFSSGLGVFFNPFLFNVNNIYEHPTDIWVAESITFLTLFHSPHLIASLTLIILVFLLMLLAFEQDKLRYSVGAGVACLFLLWFHPFNGPTIYLVLGTYLLILFCWQRRIRWSHVKHFLVLSVMPIPAVLYLFLIGRADWVIRQWSAQNILPSPSVWMYIIGYGIVLLFALIGLWITLKNPSTKLIFIIAWTVSSASLLYIPLAFQRRLSEGLHLPLAILAGLGIFYLLDQIKIHDPHGLKRYALVFSLLLFLPLTNLQIVGQDIFMYQTKKDLPYYLHQGEVDAMAWLKSNVSADGVVFSSYYMGNYIPAYSGRIVWIGHGPQTINLVQKSEVSDWFWSSDNEADAKYDLLRRDRVSYVFYGRKEKELGSYDPGTKSYLQQAFQNSDASIYRVL